MSLNTMQDLLISQLQDMYSAESQLTKALPKMAKAASHPGLATAFKTHLEETRTHLDRVTRVLEMLGEEPGDKTCRAMAGLVEEGEETMAEDGDESVLDAALIASAQRVEHYEISAYGTIRTLAELLGLDDVAELLDETLAEEKAADAKLTQIAESEVNPLAASVSSDDA